MEASVVDSVRQHRTARATQGIGFGILLYIVTLGFYSWYWVYKTEEEMGKHTGEGLGGVLGLVIWILISPVMGFVIPSEIGRCTEGRSGAAHERVDRSMAFPGAILIVIPAIVWFVKVQGALNRYWESKGRPQPRIFRLRYGEPASAYRQGRSAARVMPTRVPWVRATSPWADSSSNGGRSSGRPSCSPVTPSAWQSRPGPEQRSRSAVEPRRSRIRSSPASGSSARTSAASGVPFARADEVQAPVDAVGAVDVRVPGRAEHRPVAGRRPAVAVAGGVLAVVASTSTMRPPTPSTSRCSRSAPAPPRARSARRTRA